jgi:FG-GAP-like repeat/Cep192 domain 4/HYDIN/CFA65/VesB-like, Ig-like domain
MRRHAAAIFLLLSALALTPASAFAQNPVPFANQPLVPTSVAPGGPDFRLMVNGTGFVNGATINWNGSPLATTFVSYKQLTATVPAANIAGSQTASITVTNPKPGGGISNPVPLQVAYELTAPITTSVTTTYPTSDNATGLTAGDFNGDGITDLAVAGNHLSILLGKGDGTFDPASTYALPGKAGGLAVGDFNGDGRLDLVVTINTYFTPQVSVFLGNGDGTFQSRIDFAAGTNFALGAAVGDFNEDGKLDLVVATDSGAGLLEFLGKGDGTFQSPMGIAAGTVSLGVIPGDLDGDGHLDLVILGDDSCYKTTCTSAIYVARGDGTGKFVYYFSRGLSSSPGSAVAADFNHDGILDLAFTNTGTTQSSFGRSVTILTSLGGQALQGNVGYSVSSSPVAIAPGDFDADGNLDFAVETLDLYSSPSGYGLFFLGAGDATFTNTSTFGPGSNSSMVAGDFNRDGYIDLATASRYGNNVSVVLQTPPLSVSPGVLAFRGQLLGAARSQSITLTNNTSTPVDISSMSITGASAADFSQTNTCGTSLPQGACKITVTFTPGDLGPRAASLVITDSGPGGSQTVPLTGTGVNPIVTLSPTSLDFGSQLLTIPATKAVALSVSGDGDLSVSNVSASGNFSVAHNCAPTVANGTGCTINVTFNPATAGPLTGEVTITDNAADSPQIIQLSGTGVPPVITLSATSLDFGSLPLTLTSDPQTVTLTNTGPGPLTFNGILLGGATSDFSMTNNCPPTLPKDGQCTVNVTFKPSSANSIFGSVIIQDNGAENPHFISLRGAGVPPSVTLSPASLTFAAQLVNTTSPPQTVTVTNNGPGPLTISGYAGGGAFNMIGNCAGILAVFSSCTLSVTFAPSVNGPVSGSVGISSNGVVNPQSVSVSGTGLGPVASLSPSSLDFTDQLLGTTSAPQTVTLTNTGGATLTLSGISATVPFTQTNNCTGTLAAGGNCTIKVFFTPAVAGDAGGSLKVSSDSPSDASASLSGAGTPFTVMASSPSASVSAGGTANFTLNVATVSGFNQPITFSCIGGPPFSECSVAPNPFNPAGAGPAAVTVSVKTYAASLAAPDLRNAPLAPVPFDAPSALWVALFGLGVLAALARMRTSRLGARGIAARVALLAAVALCLSCGGGGSNVVQNSGTPAGNYVLTVTSRTTSGSTTVTHTLTLNLKVN